MGIGLGHLTGASLAYSDGGRAVPWIKEVQYIQSGAGTVEDHAPPDSEDGEREGDRDASKEEDWQRE